MNVKRIRQKNLQALRDQCDGKVNVLAEKIDTDPNYISQLLGQNGTRSVGHDLARRCEAAFGKPEGWMDRLHDPMVDEFEGIIANAPDLADEQRNAIRAQMNAVRIMIRSFTTKEPVSLR